MVFCTWILWLVLGVTNLLVHARFQLHPGNVQMLVFNVTMQCLSNHGTFYLINGQIFFYNDILQGYHKKIIIFLPYFNVNRNKQSQRDRPSCVGYHVSQHPVSSFHYLPGDRWYFLALLYAKGMTHVYLK